MTPWGEPQCEWIPFVRRWRAGRQFTALSAAATDLPSFAMRRSVASSSHTSSAIFACGHATTAGHEIVRETTRRGRAVCMREDGGAMQRKLVRASVARTQRCKTDAYPTMHRRGIWFQRRSTSANSWRAKALGITPQTNAFTRACRSTCEPKRRRVIGRVRAWWQARQPPMARHARASRRGSRRRTRA